MKINELQKLISESIKRHLSEVMDPRAYYPKVRGGWNKDKIKRNLGLSQHGIFAGIKAIAEFDDVNDFRNHLFWHGSQFRQTQLKPSIKMPIRDVERYGGGGYGEQYWGISVTSRKRTATNFSLGRGVNVHPIVLLKGSKVIRRDDFNDAADVEDIIEELWNQNVDAVYIGKEDQGEQELLVLNPRAIVNIDGASEYFEYYGIGDKIIDNPSDQQLQELLDNCKEYVERGYRQPQKPSRYMSNPDGEYQKYENGRIMQNPNYDSEIRDYYSSQEYTEWDNRRKNIENKLKFKNN